MSWKRKTPSARRRVKARKLRRSRWLARYYAGKAKNYAVCMIVNIVNVRFIGLP